MKTVLIEICANNIRYFFMLCCSTFIALNFDSILMKRRGKIYPFAIYLFIKGIFVNILLGNVLSRHYGNTKWFQIMFAVVVYACALVTLVFYYITFEGGLAKVALGTFVGDTVSAFLIEAGAFIPNFLTGRELFSLVGDFYMVDLLALTVSWGLLFLIWLFGKEFLYRYREYKLRHEKLWSGICIVFIGIASISMILGYSSSYNFWASAVFIFFALIFLFYFFNRHAAVLQVQNDYLRLQQRLSSAHYTVIQEQISRMEQSQRQIRDNMREIEHMKEAGDLQSAKVSAYLKDIRREYEQIKAGIYCGDWMIDSVLFSQSEKFKKKGIGFECSLKNFDRGEIPERELAELFLDLLEISDAAIERNKKREKQPRIILRSGRIKSGLITELKVTEAGGKMPAVRKLRKKWKRSGVEMESFKKEGEWILQAAVAFSGKKEC